MRRFYAGLIAIVILRVLLAGWFASHAPFSETLDEWNHIRYMAFIASEQRLPTEEDYPAEIPVIARNFIQYNQPPLMYLLGGGLFWLTGQRDMPPSPLPHPEPSCWRTPYDYYLHDAQSIPASLHQAMVTGRLLNILLGGVGVLLTGLAVRSWLPGRPQLAWLAALSLALYPAAVWNSAWVNNDTLLVIPGACVLWGIGLLASRKPGAIGLFGLAVILALLTKLNGIILAGVALLAWLRFQALRHWRQLLLTLLLIVGIAAAYGLFNWTRCGLPLCRLQLDSFRFSNWPEFLYYLQRPDYMTNWQEFLRSATVPNLLYDHRPAPVWMHVGGWVIGSVAIVGGVLAWWRQPPQRKLIGWSALIISTAIILMLVRIWWFTYAVAMPVRYMTLAYPAGAALFMLGWHQIIGERRMLWLLPFGWWLLVTLVSPVAFHRLNTDDVRQLAGIEATTPANTAPIIDTSASPLRLLDVQIDENALWLTWQRRPDAAINQPLIVALDLYEQNMKWLGHCALSPGGSTYNAIVWSSDEIIKQRFEFPPEILPQAETLQLSFYRTHTTHDLFTEVAPDPFYTDDINLSELRHND